MHMMKQDDRWIYLDKHFEVLRQTILKRDNIDTITDPENEHYGIQTHAVHLTTGDTIRIVYKTDTVCI